MGREINSMNPVIAESRNKKRQSEKSGISMRQYRHKCEELVRAEKQYPQLMDRQESLQEEIKVIGEEIKMLSLDPQQRPGNECSE